MQQITFEQNDSDLFVFSLKFSETSWNEIMYKYGLYGYILYKLNH